MLKISKNNTHFDIDTETDTVLVSRFVNSTLCTINVYSIDTVIKLVSVINNYSKIDDDIFHAMNERISEA